MAEFFEVDTGHVLIATAGLVVILACWLPRFVSHREPAPAALMLVLSAAAFALLPGMPPAFDPRENPILWELTSEIAVIAALFGTGLRIDELKHWREWGPTVRLLALAMPLTIAAVAALGVWWGGLTLAAAILVGAVLSPTDPVLAGDLQVGPPQEGDEHPVRFALSAEAGLNDGLAFPFVHLGVAVAAGAFALSDLAHWALVDVLWRIGVGVLVGAGLGWLLGRVLFVWPPSRPLAETSAGIAALAGILISYGATEVVEGYGFVAVFVTGLTLRRVEEGHGFHRRLHDFSNAIEHALTALILVLLGGALPTLFAALTMADVAIALALIVVIRPLAAGIALLGCGLPRGERRVVAFYGVRGVGSIYYLAYATGHVEFVNEAQLWALVGFVILVSTAVHGFTAPAILERMLARPR